MIPDNNPWVLVIVILVGMSLVGAGLLARRRKSMKAGLALLGAIGLPAALIGGVYIRYSLADALFSRATIAIDRERVASIEELEASFPHRIYSRNDDFFAMLTMQEQGRWMKQGVQGCVRYSVLGAPVDVFLDRQGVPLVCVSTFD